MEEKDFITAAIQKGIATFPQIEECLQAQQAMAKAGVLAKIWEVLVVKKHATQEQVNAILIPVKATKTLAFGPFMLQSKLGEGGMGVVYRAVKQGETAPVALKILPEKFSETDSAQRFEREARNAIALSHPNLVKGFEFGKVNNRLYYSMEFVKGRVVSVLIKEKKYIEEKAALQIALQIAGALDAIHKHGLVHRDVKPENIIVGEDGIVKLMDLGLVKSTLGDMASLTQDGKTIGSPHYMSPEQIRAKEVDGRSDLYSLGATLYHMVTGIKPFDAATALEVFKKQLERESLADPRAGRPELSPGLCQVLEKMLARESADRHGSATDLMADLSALIDGHPPKSARLPPGRSVMNRAGAGPTQRMPPPTQRLPEPATKPPASSKVVLYAGVGALVLVLAVAGFLLFRGSPDKPGAAALSPEEIEKTVRGHLSSGEFNEAAKLLQQERTVLGEPKAAALELALGTAASQKWDKLQNSLKPELDKGRYDFARKEIDKFRAQADEVPGMDVKILRGQEWVAQAERQGEQKRNAQIRFEAIEASIHSLEVNRDLSRAIELLTRARGTSQENPFLVELIDGKLRRLRDAAGMAPLPAPTPAPAPSPPPTNSAEQILLMADRLLDDARSLYEEGKMKNSVDALNEAGFKAEDARIKYQAVQEVLESDRQKYAADQLKISVQLSKLINDAKKSIGGPVPTPTPKPAPTPEPSPTPAPEPAPEPVKKPDNAAAVEACAGLLAKFAAGDSGFKISDARAMTRSLLIKGSGPDERVSAALCIFLRVEQDPALVSDAERKALQEYLAKVDWKKFDDMSEADHGQAIDALEAARAKVQPGAALFVLEMAHLNRLLKITKANVAFTKWSEKLGLSMIDLPEGLCLTTPAGGPMFRALQKGEPNATQAIGELKRTSLPNDASFAFFRAYFQFVAYSLLPSEDKKKEFGDLAKLFRELKPPEPYKKLCKDIGEALKAPCKRCSGDGTIKCPVCDNGQASFVCNVCKGWGGTEKFPCRNCKGVGGDCNTCKGKGFVFAKPCAACQEKGRWKDDCTKCKGTGKQKCPNCKEAWVEPKPSDYLAPAPCPSCRKTGFTFDRVLLPCPDCSGLGQCFSEGPALTKKK